MELLLTEMTKMWVTQVGAVNIKSFTLDLFCETSQKTVECMSLDFRRQIRLMREIWKFSI